MKRTLLNPVTHLRNIVANFFLSDDTPARLAYVYRLLNDLTNEYEHRLRLEGREHRLMDEFCDSRLERLRGARRVIEEMLQESK